MIKAKEYIKTGFSANDAQQLLAAIEPLLNQNKKVQIDFSDIQIYTTLFFNNALTKYVVQLGPEKFKETFELLHLTEIGQSTFQHSYDNALEYYYLTEAQKDKQNELLSDFNDD